MRPLLDLSSACGARCVYCLHQSLGLAPQRFMDFSVFAKISAILHREGIRYVYLYLSGESILHPRFYDCLALLGQLRLTANIATKLPVAIKKAELEKILSATATPVIFDVTIDSLNPETAVRIAPGIKTAVVLQSLSELSDLRKSHPQLVVTVTTVVNRHNESDLSSIKQYFAGLGLPWHAKPMGYYMGSKITPASEKAIAELVPLNPAYRSRFRIEKGRVRSLATRCIFYDPAISADGDVSVCCHDMLFEIKTGNVLRENSLLRVIRSDAYQKARRLGNQMRLSICQGCN